LGAWWSTRRLPQGGSLNLGVGHAPGADKDEGGNFRFHGAGVSTPRGKRPGKTGAAGGLRVTPVNEGRGSTEGAEAAVRRRATIFNRVD